MSLRPSSGFQLLYPTPPHLYPCRPTRTHPQSLPMYLRRRYFVVCVEAACPHCSISWQALGRSKAPASLPVPWGRWSCGDPTCGHPQVSALQQHNVAEISVSAVAITISFQHASACHVVHPPALGHGGTLNILSSCQRGFTTHTTGRSPVPRPRVAPQRHCPAAGSRLHSPSCATAAFSAPAFHHQMIVAGGNHHHTMQRRKTGTHTHLEAQAPQQPRLHQTLAPGRHPSSFLLPILLPPPPAVSCPSWPSPDPDVLTPSKSSAQSRHRSQVGGLGSHDPAFLAEMISKMFRSVSRWDTHRHP